MSFIDDSRIGVLHAVATEEDGRGPNGSTGASTSQSLRKTNSTNDPGRRIFSVSFKETGSIRVQEQSREEFADHILRPRQLNSSQQQAQSPEIEVPRSSRYEKSPLTSASLPAGTTPRRSYLANASTPARNPTIYCIHGNTFGIAKCCETLDGSRLSLDRDGALRAVGEDNATFEWDDSAISHSDTRPILDPNCRCHGSESGFGQETSVDKRARKKLLMASVLCLVFMVGEAVGGALAGSLAIATDAAHLLTDLISFMISLFSLWVASRPATQAMSFGWHRAEVLGATISILMIWLVTGILFYMAVLRCINKQFEIDAKVMLITSGIGVIVNIFMGLTLHQGHGHSHGGGGGGHGHSHGGGHDSEAGAGEEESHRTNVNVKAAFVHVIGDFLSSVGVFIAALIIYFKPEYPYTLADPICTFIFSVLVLGTTIRILRDTINVLMEGIPRDVDFNVVRDLFLSIDGIVAVHNLRIWGLTTDKTALSAHIAIKPDLDEQDALRLASAKIRSQYNIYEMTLQLERFHEEMDECTKCKPPTT